MLGKGDPASWTHHTTLSFHEYFESLLFKMMIVRENFKDVLAPHNLH